MSIICLVKLSLTNYLCLYNLPNFGCCSCACSSYFTCSKVGCHCPKWIYCSSSRESSTCFPNILNNAANRAWSDPSGIITTSNKFILSSDRYYLVVQDVGPNNSGLYTFTAANTLGSATVTIRLGLQGKQL